MGQEQLGSGYNQAQQNALAQYMARVQAQQKAINEYNQRMAAQAKPSTTSQVSDAFLKEVGKQIAKGEAVKETVKQALGSSNPNAITAALGTGDLAIPEATVPSFGSYGLESAGGYTLAPELGATSIAPEVTGFNLAGTTPAGLTEAGGFAGLPETGGASGIGAYALPAVAGIGGLLMARQGYRKRNPLTGAIGGGLGAAGLIGGLQAAGAMGALGPAGLALAIGGGALAGGLGGLLKKKKSTDIEQKRWQDLIAKGLVSKEEIIPSFLIDTKGGPAFDDVWNSAKSDEEKAKLIMGYSDFVDKLGSDYLKADEAAKVDIAKMFSGGESAGDFRERKGTIDLNWTPAKEAAAKQRLIDALKKAK